MAEMTPADFGAMMNNGYGTGEWFWIVILLFAFMNNGWGNNNDYARESTVNSQFVERDIWGTNQNVSNTKYDLATNILENRYVNQLAECETRKDILLGDANLQKDILLGNQTLASNMATCCCDLKTAIHAEGEETRALITANRIAELEYQLNQANTAVANAVQTQNILNSLGSFFPKQGVNPYAIYGYGTTIA